MPRTSVSVTSKDDAKIERLVEELKEMPMFDLLEVPINKSQAMRIALNYTLHGIETGHFERFLEIPDAGA